MFDVEVKLSGPVLTGRGAAIVRDGIQEMMREVSYYAEEQVESYEGGMINPTGTWAGGIDVDEGATEHRVHPDEGLPYNHWLEGVGSRNRTTSFKGYRMWRESYQATRQQADVLAERGARAMVRRLNG